MIVRVVVSLLALSACKPRHFNSAESDTTDAPAISSMGARSGLEDYDNSEIFSCSFVDPRGPHAEFNVSVVQKNEIQISYGAVKKRFSIKSGSKPETQNSEIWKYDLGNKHSLQLRVSLTKKEYAFKLTGKSFGTLANVEYICVDGEASKDDLDDLITKTKTR